MPIVIPYPPTNGTIADGTQMQADFAALLGAINNALLRDGSIPMLGALAMGGYKIGGVADPTLLQDAATMNWVQTYLTAQGYANASALTAYLTIAAAASTYAPLASPALTGVPLANGAEIGFRDLLTNVQSGAYTLALLDRGRMVLVAGNVTIPANSSVAFPLGAAVTLVNTSGISNTVAITTDTLTLAGSSLTGPRTLSPNGIATVVKTGATSWLIAGPGVS